MLLSADEELLGLRQPALAHAQLGEGRHRRRSELGHVARVHVERALQGALRVLPPAAREEDVGVDRAARAVERRRLVLARELVHELAPLGRALPVAGARARGDQVAVRLARGCGRCGRDPPRPLPSPPRAVSSPHPDGRRSPLRARGCSPQRPRGRRRRSAARSPAPAARALRTPRRSRRGVPAPLRPSPVRSRGPTRPRLARRARASRGPRTPVRRRSADARPRRLCGPRRRSARCGRTPRRRARVRRLLRSRRRGTRAPDRARRAPRASPGRRGRTRTPPARCPTEPRRVRADRRRSGGLQGRCPSIHCRSRGSTTRREPAPRSGAQPRRATSALSVPPGPGRAHRRPRPPRSRDEDSSSARPPSSPDTSAARPRSMRADRV